MVRTYDTLQVPEQFGSIDTKTVDDALQEPKGRSKFLNRLSFNHHDSQKNKTNSKSSLTSDGEFSDDESYEEYNESKFSDYSETNDNSDFNYARKVTPMQVTELKNMIDFLILLKSLIDRLE